MRRFIKKILHPFLKSWLNWYYRKPRKFSYKDVEVLVHPDVFPPHLTISTTILLEFIDTLNLEKAALLELGCGCGIISLYAAKRGAMVTATDINPTAIEFLESAALENKLQLRVLYSDLFESIKDKSFQYIIINPPYYPRNPQNIKEMAWFCGEDFEYFKRLFQELSEYASPSTSSYMILSEDCEIDRIKSIAMQNSLDWKLVWEKRKHKEMSYIFRLEQHEKFS